MSPNFQSLMNEAARLTRSGDLTSATALIQEALKAEGSTEAQSRTVATTEERDIIDVEAREIPTHEAAPPSAEPEQRQTARPEAPEAKARSTPAGTSARDVFVAGRFGTGRASREYKLYVPPHAGERPLPLIVMLHGCTQDPDDFAAGTAMNDIARSQDCFVLYPAQTQQANPQRCWNWFKHNHQERGRGEPALLAGMTRHVMEQYSIDASRVYVAGLSAGGAMAAILGATYPELYAAVGVHSGLAAGSAKDLPSALAAMRSGAAGAAQVSKVPTIVFHGDADGTVHASNGEHIISASGGAKPHAADRERASGGRSYTRRVHRTANGEIFAEHWVVHGSGHAWSGGTRKGTYTDPEGPDASREMLRFFLEHPRQ